MKTTLQKTRVIELLGQLVLNFFFIKKQIFYKIFFLKLI
jgi:hypothetical protein